MQMVSLVGTTLTTLAALLWLGRAGEPKCGCASRQAQREISYTMVFDALFPEPRVVGTAQQGGKSIIWVSYLGFHRGTHTERVLRSSDDGRTWLADPSFQKVGLRSPSNRDVVYDTSRDLFARSVDGGQHWVTPRFQIQGHAKEDFIRGLAHANPASLHCGIVAIDPQDPFTIYGGFTIWILSHNAPHVYVPGIYVSHDGGDTWSLFSEKLQGPSLEGPSSLGISPSHRNVMIGVGQKSVVISRDGGRTWLPVGEQEVLEQPATLKGWTGDRAVPEWAYLQIQQIEFQPDNENVVFLLTNKGLYRSDDGVQTWCLLDTKIERLFQVGSLVIDPSNPRRIYVGTDQQVVVSDDSGCHFRTLFDWKKLTRR
jgi:hypothetical protein